MFQRLTQLQLWTRIWSFFFHFTVKKSDNENSFWLTLSCTKSRYFYVAFVHFLGGSRFEIWVKWKRIINHSTQTLCQSVKSCSSSRGRERKLFLSSHLLRKPTINNSADTIFSAMTSLWDMRHFVYIIFFLFRKGRRWWKF